MAVLIPKRSCLAAEVPTSGCSTVQGSSTSIAVLEVAAKVANSLNSKRAYRVVPTACNFRRTSL